MDDPDEELPLDIEDPEDLELLPELLLGGGEDCLVVEPEGLVVLVS